MSRTRFWQKKQEPCQKPSNSAKMPVRASTAPRVALAAAVGLLATSAGVDAAIADPSSCSAPAVSDPTSDSFKVGSPAGGGVKSTLPPAPPARGRAAGERPGGRERAAQAPRSALSGALSSRRPALREVNAGAGAGGLTWRLLHGTHAVSPGVPGLHGPDGGVPQGLRRGRSRARRRGRDSEVPGRPEGVG